MLAPQAPEAVNTQLAVALAGIVGGGLTLATQLIAKRVKEARSDVAVTVNGPNGHPSGAVGEGRFQERMEWMLKGLADTIERTHAAHEKQMEPIVRGMNDAAQAMRAVVDEVEAHSKESKSSHRASVEMLPLTQDIHAEVVPKSPYRKTRRR